MKRYEQMSKEEIMGIFGTPLDCFECKIRAFCDSCHKDTCGEVRAAYLEQEIKMVPRIATINTVEELEMAWADWHGKRAVLFYDYLAEEIEVEND